MVVRVLVCTANVEQIGNVTAQKAHQKRASNQCNDREEGGRTKKKKVRTTAQDDVDAGRAWVASNMSGTDKRGKTAMLGAGDSTRRGRRGGAMGITPYQRAKNKAAQEAADFNDDNDFRSPVRPSLIVKKGVRVKRQAHMTSDIPHQQKHYRFCDVIKGSAWPRAVTQQGLA